MLNLLPILLKRPLYMEIGAVVQVVAFEARLPGLVQGQTHLLGELLDLFRGEASLAALCGHMG